MSAQSFAVDAISEKRVRPYYYFTYRQCNRQKLEVKVYSRGEYRTLIVYVKGGQAIWEESPARDRSSCASHIPKSYFPIGTGDIPVS